MGAIDVIWLIGACIAFVIGAIVFWLSSFEACRGWIAGSRNAMKPTQAALKEKEQANAGQKVHRLLDAGVALLIFAKTMKILITVAIENRKRTRPFQTDSERVAIHE